MPRRARHYLAGMPYHIVQRGNNRQKCFLEPQDYRYYLKLWREMSRRYRAQVHAYCLMTNHIHFLVTPSREDSISRIMRVVGSQFARYVNIKYERTGTLWEGRHRASLIQTQRYLLTCQRYIELNPVRAGMVTSPEHYLWSSFTENALGAKGWMQPHPDFLVLGKTAESRRASYQALFEHSIPHRDMALIRQAMHFCQPTADKHYLKELKETHGLRIGRMKRGKPPKKTAG